MKIVLLVITLALGVSGCASIVNGQSQPLSVITRSRGVDLAGANCKLSNDKGSWFVTTPGSTTVTRSYGELNVSCEKPGSEPTTSTVKSSTKAMAFGNILFGGIIGAGVDVATGAAYDYPTVIEVDMQPVSIPIASVVNNDSKPLDLPVPSAPVGAPMPVASPAPIVAHVPQ
jgi:hypothetical protein